MAFIPEHAEWFIAQIVLEIKIEDEEQNIVHVNYVLVRASSPEDAYERALALGREHESEYLNSAGRIVHIRFCGLRDLVVIYDNIEHGAELFYEERIGVSREGLNALTRGKESLSIFTPLESGRGPDYGSGVIRQEAKSAADRRRQEQ